jgi:hypothetical protein
MELHQHFDTHIDPSCSLQKTTNHILNWIRTAKKIGSKKKTPKIAETQGCRVWTSPCTGGGGQEYQSITTHHPVVLRCFATIQWDGNRESKRLLFICTMYTDHKKQHNASPILYCPSCANPVQSLCALDQNPSW